MILGLVSMILGVVVLIAIWPYSFDSFNAIASYLVILLLIIFGGRIFFIDFKKYLMVRNKKNQYFAQLEDQLASKQTPNYPPYDLLSQPSVLSKVVKLIKLRQVKNAQPILNNEVAFKAAQLKFMFFSWLFKENDDYRTYKNWKKIYKRIHQATSDVISDVFSDLEQGSYLVDIANTKADGLSPGSYVLKQEESTWTLTKIPIHTRYIADDFYGTMIYDTNIDQNPYSFETDNILTKKEQHIKQTTRFFHDIEGRKYKKDETREIKCLRVKLKNQEGFDLISYDLPF